MTALILVGLLSFMTGVGAAEAADQLVRRFRDRRHEEDPRLTEQDHADIAAEFAIHTTAVWSQVRGFADALADGDAELREQLRRFEGGR